MRSDANEIALRAIRNILTNARSFELTIEGRQVKCSVTQGPPEDWPPIEGLSAEAHGPWPPEVAVDCAWDDGRVALTVRCGYWKATGRYRHLLGLRVGLAERTRELVWITVPRYIRNAEDGYSAPLRGSVSTVKRREDGKRERSRAVNELLRELLGSSGLPKFSAATAEICRVAVPSGAVEPSPDVALRRVVHLALLKFDFLDRGKRPQNEGKPLINVAGRLGEDAPEDDELEELPDEDDDEDDVDEAEPSARLEDGARKYWAGGIAFSGDSRRDEFVNGRYWQVGWPRTTTTARGRVAWRRFDQIKVGDWFAIKGEGPRNQLKVHLLGEVTAIEPQSGRIDLRLIERPHYRGPAPDRAGAGNFRDALVPIEREDIVELIFGSTRPNREPSVFPRASVPLNLILYGPPGTGKTYHLMSKLFPLFTRSATQSGDLDRATEVARDLTWFECIALALQQLGGQAKVNDLLAHPVMKAKHALSPHTQPRQMVWGTLSQHAVESSTTVKMKRRLGELIFDKEPDGTWKLVEGVPEEVENGLEQLKTREPRAEVRDFTFVTFHQAYAYEDFIEGIRPRLATSGNEDDVGVTYELVDGVFKAAAQAAIRLAGFSGTLDEFCALPRDERRRKLQSAPRHAVFVDEINRGNVARIFGELITLLEPDKRLGADNELIVTLPYSRSRFGVPSNLHMIGTMNTADRSVEALDAALRRRFQFQELAPDPAAVNILVEDQIDTAVMLRTINRRVEKLLDRDHTIGHAFFEPLRTDPSVRKLRDIFQRSIIPLLQEYFFGDWGKIGLVLGAEFVIRRPNEAFEFAAFDYDEQQLLAERPTYELKDISQLTSAAFRSIYENVADD